MARAVDPAPPVGGEPVSLVGLTHNDGKGMKGEPLKRGPLTKLRAAPSTDSAELDAFPVNTRVFVDRRLGTWYHVIVEKGGHSGYMAADLVETDLPDPESQFHRIGVDESAFEIVNQRYQVGADAGYRNLRFYANGLVQVNRKRNRTGIYEPSDEEKIELLKRAFASQGRFVYVDAGTKAHYQILLPSKSFADTLDVSSGSWVRDVGHKAMQWVEGALKVVAFPAGLIVGALECLWDTVAGIAELAWGILKGIVTGGLFAELQEMAEGLAKLITDPATRQAALTALADWLEDRWENRNPAKRWYWRGWIIGYLATTVIIAFFSLGETLLAKAAGKMKALYNLVKTTGFGGKAIRAVEAAAATAKNSRAATAIKAAAASKPAKVAGAVVKAPFVAVWLARAWAAAVLRIPASVLRDISDAGVLALRKLSPKAGEALRRVSALGDRGIQVIRRLFGCRSPCKFTGADLGAVESKLRTPALRKLAKQDPQAWHALVDRYHRMSDSSLRRRLRTKGGDETARWVLEQRYPSNAEAHKRALGSDYRPPHSATVTRHRPKSDKPWRRELTSGNMTADEASLGWPQNMLATHTEARAVRMGNLKDGDLMSILGQYDPCSSCRRAMQEAATRSGATIRYRWPGGVETFTP